MKTILVPTDFNELARTALRQAVQIAHTTGAGIVVLYADTFQPPAEFTAGQAADLAAAIAESRRRAAEELAQWAREIVPSDVPHETLVIEDFAVAAIVDLAETRDADLIVMGTHGRGGIARVLLGSVTEAVLRETRRPVMTVNRTGDAKRISTVACADASASASAERFAAELQAAVIPAAEEADLLVVCQTNRQLVRHAGVPVLTVRGEKGSRLRAGSSRGR